VHVHVHVNMSFTCACIIRHAGGLPQPPCPTLSPTPLDLNITVIGVAREVSGSQLYLGQRACQKGLGSGASSAGSSTAAAPAPTETAATATAATRAMILL
jgi:hypothetical protein